MKYRLLIYQIVLYLSCLVTPFGPTSKADDYSVWYIDLLPYRSALHLGQNNLTAIYSCEDDPRSNAHDSIVVTALPPQPGESDDIEGEDEGDEGDEGDDGDGAEDEGGLPSIGGGRMEDPM